MLWPCNLIALIYSRKKIIVKNYFRCYIFVGCILIFSASCKKQTEGRGNNCPAVLRKIQFSLYTDRDFSDNNSNIIFTLSIRTADHQVLWDSVLPPMRIRDIPHGNNKFFFEKQVPGNESSLLRAGFIYAIEHVGISWFWDQSKACDTLKKVDFNFR